MDLQAARTQQGIVDHVLPIRHSDQQDVVQGIHTVDLGKQLIDDGVGHARSIADAATLLADGIHLVHDDDVQHAVVAGLHLLLLGLSEQLSDFLFGRADVLAQDLGTVDNLRLPRVQGLSDLPCNQRLSAAGWSVEQHSANVVDSHLLDDVRWPDARGKSASEDLVELGIQTSDAQLFKVEVADEEVGRRSAGAFREMVSAERNSDGAFSAREAHHCRLEQLSHLGSFGGPFSAFQVGDRAFLDCQLELRSFKVDCHGATRGHDLFLQQQHDRLRQACRVEVLRSRFGIRLLLGQHVHAHLQGGQRHARVRNERRQRDGSVQR
mmetsp:Transcript_11995/g.34660  ORF Transcript_11995/g.34660 Transcript_11995/m.34660 type:complete len:323 (+) Transcript_11995:1105-2073(+)